MHFSFSDKNFSFCHDQHLLRRTASWSTSCVALRPTSKSPSSKTLCTHRWWTCTPNVSSRFDSLEIRVLLVADVGQLDDNLSINLVVPHHRTVHTCAAACLSLLARLTSNRSTRGPLTSSPAFTFCASARTFTFFLNLCCSGSLCQTVPVA